MFRQIVLSIAVMMALCATCAAQAVVGGGTKIEQFPSHGRLIVRLRSGELHIIGSRNSHVLHLQYTLRSDHPDFVRKVHLQFESQAGTALIAFRAPSASGGEVDATIEVPQETNLGVRMTAGELKISAVDGDKDLAVHVGEIHLAIGSKSSFRLVQVSTDLGDVSQSLFGRPSGWLGKSVTFRGGGTYRLYAHVWIGDIKITGRADSPEALGWPRTDPLDAHQHRSPRAKLCVIPSQAVMPAVIYPG
jgi:hypothetical protein